MLRSILSVVTAGMLVAGFAVLTLPVQAGGWCTGPFYQVGAIGIAEDYNDAYTQMVGKLNTAARNYNDRCQTFGTCQESITIVEEVYLGIGTWYIRGIEDFRCRLDF
ncbi:MAG: hypothetical protein QNK37_24435 [Acidobacteriota bacterium]|nr:hypothetical protein [Acidobacteriota bacterium]